MSPYLQIIIFIAIGISEYWLSKLNHQINIGVLTRKKNLATWKDLIANILSEIIPFIVYVTTQNWVFMLPRIIGNTLGTRKVAGRPIKNTVKKPVSKKKLPFTSA